MKRDRKTTERLAMLILSAGLLGTIMPASAADGDGGAGGSLKAIDRTLLASSKSSSGGKCASCGKSGICGQCASAGKCGDSYALKLKKQHQAARVRKHSYKKRNRKS